MNTFSEIGIYLIQATVSLYLLIVLLRFLLQLCRANFFNPVSQFVVKATAPPLAPLQKIFPAFNTFNSAALALALLLQILAIQGSMLIYSGNLLPVTLLLAWSAIGIGSMLINIYLYGLLIAIVLSWIAPQSQHPAIALIWQLADPVMSPFRKILPPMGGLDFSPILILLLLNVLRIVITNLAQATHLPPLIVPGIM